MKDDVMKKINIDEMKNIEIQILETLSVVCKKNNLKLYLGGGTLLGAVRHHGFIPWDDDVDVMMLRDEYEKLLEIFDNDEINSVKILSYKNTSDYYYPFAKAVNINTFMDETIVKKIKDMGVYVDIFPIDKIPNNAVLRKFIFLKKDIYQKIFNFTSSKDVYSLSKNKVKKFLKILVTPFLKLIPIDFAAKKLDGLVKKYNKKNCNDVACITGAYSKKEIMPKEYISDSVEVEFEGGKYLAPIGYNDYLVKHYNKNYMELPPKEKQISNHDNECYWK